MRKNIYTVNGLARLLLPFFLSLSVFSFAQNQICPPPPGPEVVTCTDSTLLGVTCFVNGDPLSGNLVGDMDGFVMYNYDNEGNTGYTRGVPVSQIGTVWGTAYNNLTSTIYVSAFLKRHSGFGPLGPGGIYKIVSAPGPLSATPFVDLAMLGINVGTDPRSPTIGVVDDPNELASDPVKPSWDVDAFPMVAKTSLGGLEVSTDGNTLWAISLTEKELVGVDISGNTPSLLSQIPIPNPGCPNDDYWPFGLKYHDNKIWVGITCTGETNQDEDELRAYVVCYTNNSFLPVFDFPLDYRKGYAGGDGGTEGDTWHPWNSTYQSISNRPDFTVYPTPVLSDIEFDIDGSMILGFMDRSGHQIGFINYKPSYPATDLIQSHPGGDIIRVCNVGGTYMLEDNGLCPGEGPRPPIGDGSQNSGENNTQGPGGGEYYWGEVWAYNPYNNNDGFHQETSFGGLCFKPGTGEVVVSAYDPTDSGVSGGTIKLSNSTGRKNGGFRLYAYGESPFSLGKANGIGGLVVFCASEPRPDCAGEFACPPDLSINCDEDIPPAYANLDEFIAAGGVAEESLAITGFSLDNETSSTGTCPFELVRTYTASDECESTHSCMQTIVQNDTGKPILTCPDDATVDCQQDPVFGTPEVSDICDMTPTLSVVSTIEIPGNCPQERSVVRTWTATDDCGNTATSCSQTIFIEDSTPPSVTCPSGTTIQCDDDLELPLLQLSAFTNAGGVVNDNCGTPVFSYEFETITTTSCPKIVTRTYQVDDQCGNSAQCTQQIFINDNTNPTITCPANITVQCNSDIPDRLLSLDDFIAAGGSADDNCGAVFAFAGESESGSCPRVIVRNYNMTDLCNNSQDCVHRITIDDTIDPVFVCPQDLTVQCIDEVHPPYPTLVDFEAAGGVASDNCGIESYSPTGVTATGDCPTVVHQTYQVVDSCNNITSCTHTIIVDDTTPPVLQDLPDLTINCEDTPPANLPTVSDNCDDNVELVSTYDETVLDCPSNHLIIRTFTATDNCDNISVTTQSIWSLDTQGPVFTYVPEDMTVECHEMPFLPSPQATDNCWVCVISYHDEIIPGSCPLVQTIVRKWEASDQCGHTAYATQTISIIDNTAPVITYTGGMHPGLHDGDTLALQCNEMLMIGESEFDIQDCSAVTFQTDIDTISIGICNVDGYQSIVRHTIRVTDICGHESVYHIFIKWIDNQAPWFSQYPENLAIHCDGAVDISQIEAWLDSNGGAEAGDYCSELHWSNNFNLAGFDPSCNGLTEIEVTFHAEDACGNVSSANATLTVIGDPMSVVYCSHSESFYGNSNSTPVVENMLNGGDILVFGVQGRQFSIKAEAAACIASLLKSNGKIKALPLGNKVLSGGDCNAFPLPVNSDGSLKNRLLGATIALTLNTRNSAALKSLQLSQDCLDTDPLLFDLMGNDAKVADLLQLSNNVLGKAVTLDKTDLAKVYHEIIMVNQTFEDCHACINNGAAPLQALQQEEISNAAIAEQLEAARENKDVASIEIFPNPASDKINIALLGFNQSACQIDILSESGQLLYRTENASSDAGIVTIQTRALTNGIYNIRVKCDEKVFNEKCIIIRK